MTDQGDLFRDAPPPSGGVPIRARRLDLPEIERIVDRAFNGEVSLQALMDRAMFGGVGEPENVTWGDWPDHAIDAWDAATSLYRERTREAEREREEAEQRLMREVAWQCVEEAVPPGRAFPSLAHVHNADIPRPPDMQGRSFMRELINKQHWQFAGRGGSRRVVRAPCVECGRVVRVRDLEDRYCPDCSA